jgi:hypothetical protein
MQSRQYRHRDDSVAISDLMPARRLHDRQHGSPVDQLSEHHERDSRRIIGPAGFDPALSVECQLLPEKQILGRQLRARSEAERHESESIDQQLGRSPPHD